MTNKTCPLCKKNLSLKQVNFNLAVYICEDLKCSYPVGCDECIVVERALEDMNKNIEHFNEKDEDLTDWIDDVVNNKEKTPVATTIINLTDPVEKGQDHGWIDDLVEEAVNEVKRYETTETHNTPKETESSAVDTDFDEILNFIYTN